MTISQKASTSNNYLMYKFSFFIIVLFLAIQPSAFAGVEGSVKRFSSSDLVVNSVLKVQDNKYPDAPGKSVLVNSKGNVRLGIDFSKNPLSPFTVEVYVSITKYSNANPSTFTVKSETLKVENNATLHATHIDQNVFKCDNASRIEVTILQINVSGNAPIPPSVYLQADIQTERYYKIDPLSVYPKGNLFNKPLDVSIPLDGISDELQVSWANIAGVEEYDLEWTYVNNYVGTMDNTGTPDFIAPKNLSYSFRHNATRVRVNKNSYNIPLVYEHGYILYRLRSVGRDLSDPTKIITGLWSSDLSTGAVVSTNASEGIVGNFTERYQIVNAKETNKNWQYAATYAEDGKKKEVVSYFDGSSRSRQSVTKSNTENLTIVGETVYDYQGRPAIQILPVPTPTEEKEIKFYDKFNVNGLGKRYSRLDFDLGADCVPPTGLMNSTSGASNYYSSDNTNKDGAQAFVPDAEKFPFTQIEYTPDNTGRIGRQSGVGPNHKLGSNHEIKYFYGQPEQQQLDRLFGSEVGNYNRYKKNMVVDANGQVSVSYLDSKGKVIATSLVARGAVNTAALASNPAVAQELTYTYIDHGKGKGGTEQGNALVFSKELLVTVAGNFTLDYSFVTPFYNTSDACGMYL
jgi:hypothetical protein